MAGCSGCSGTCELGCSDYCSGNCADSCSGQCGNDCHGNCESECDLNCASSCDGSCEGGCSGCSGTCTRGCTSCTGTCTVVCGGSCTGGCTGTCSGKCDNACTAAGKADAIAALGLSQIMIAKEVTDIKAAIEKEFNRRAMARSNPYTVPPVQHGRVLEEHGRKILEDCKAMDPTKDWVAQVQAGKIASKAVMDNAVKYIKELAVEIAVK